MKNKNSSNTVSTIIGFIIILILLFIIVKTAIFLYINVDKININLAVAVLAGSFTIIGFFVTRYLERKKIIEQQIREQKLPIYQEFVDFVFQVLQGSSSKYGKKISEKEMENFFWTLNEKSILWLSDKTLKSYCNWKNNMGKITKENSDSPEEQSVKLLLEFENLLLDFRKDIGHKNKNLTDGDILSLFVTDWAEFSNNRKL